MVGFAIRVTAVLLIWAAAQRVLRRTSAESRCLAHGLAVAALLLLPVLIPLLPSLPLALLPPAASSPTTATAGTIPEPSATTPLTTMAPATTASPSTPSPHDALPVLLRTAPLWLIAIGAALGLLRLALGLAGLRRLVRRCTAPSETLTQALERARHPLDVWRPVRLVLAPDDVRLSSPMTAGWRHHVVVLPAAAESWPSEHLDATLRHELAHIRREDWLLLVLTRLVLALYWFHPLAHLLVRTYRADMEAAADDRVVRSGLRPSDYAAHLTEIAAFLH